MVQNKLLAKCLFGKNNKIYENIIDVNLMKMIVPKSNVNIKISEEILDDL